MASNNAGSIFFDIKVNDQLSEQIAKSIENVQKLGEALDDVEKAALMKDVGRGAETLKRALYDINRLRRQMEESVRRSVVLGVDTKSAEENIERLKKKEQELVDISSKLATMPSYDVWLRARGANATNLLKESRDNLDLQRRMNGEAERYEKSMKSVADVSRSIGDAMSRLRTSITAGNLAGMDTRRLQSQLSALETLRQGLPVNISKHQMGSISGMLTESGRMSAAMNESVKNIDKIDDRLRRLRMTREKLGNSMKTGNMLGVDTSSSAAEMRVITKQIENLRALRERMTKGTGGVTDAEINARYKDVAESASKAAAAQEKANKARVSGNKEDARNLNAVESALNRIIAARDKLSSHRDVARAMGMDTASMDAALSKLDDYGTKILGADLRGGAAMSRGASLGALLSQSGLLGAESDKNVRSLRSVEDKMHDLVTLRERLESGVREGSQLGIDTSKAEDEIKRLEQRMQSLAALRDRLQKNPSGVNMNKELRGYHEVVDAARRAAAEQEKANTQTQRSRERSAKSAQQAQERANRQAMQDSKRAANEQKRVAKQREAAIDQVEKKLYDLQRLEGKALKMGVDTSELQKAIWVLNVVYNELLKVKSQAELDAVMRRSSPNVRGMYQGGLETAREAMSSTRDAMTAARAKDAQTVRDQTKAEAELNREKKEAEAWNRRILGQMEQLEQQSSSLGGVFGELGDQIRMAFSIYGIENFLKSVITVGGEFEQQRVALQSILGNLQHADTMYSELKKLAVVSPFSFLDLTSYAKQLSAFSIPYDELYDTTKRLSDISAGLGVDMSRIILAYGQVRSASVLRGQELRQFTEAGIPMVDALAKKLSEARGELVSTADVFKLISQRAVSFNMVKEVLWDMTDETGKFYNMQLVLSDTLYGKWSNLRDAWEIMLSEIADGEGVTGGLLKDMVSGLTELTRLVNDLLPAITALMVSFGARTLGGWASRKGLSAGYAMKTALTNISRQDYNAALSKRMSGGTLNAREQALIASQGKILANDRMRLAMLNSQDTAMLRQMRSVGLLSQNDARRLFIQGQITREQLHQLTVSRSLIAAGQTMRGVFAGIGGTMKSLGWMALFSLAVEGISLLIDKFREAERIASHAAKGWAQHYQNLSNVVKELNASAPGNEGEYSSGIETMMESLKEVRSDYAAIKREAEGISDLGERYAYLKGRLEETAAAYGWMAQNKQYFEDVINGTKAGLLGETIVGTAEDYDDAFQELESARRFVTKYREDILREISGSLDEGTRRSFGLIGKTVDEQLDIISKNASLRDKISWDGLTPDEEDVVKNYMKLRGEVDAHGKILARKAEQVARELAEGSGVDLNNVTEANKAQLRMMFDGFNTTFEERSDATQTLIRDTMYKLGQLMVIPDADGARPRSNMFKYVRGRLSTLLFSDADIQDLTEDDGGTPKSWETLMKRVKDEYEDAKRRVQILEGQRGDTSVISKDLQNARDELTKWEEAYKALYVNTDKENAKANQQPEDKWLQNMGKQITLLERYMSVYRELADVYGEVEAKRRMAESGDYSSLAALGITDPGDTVGNYDKVLSSLRANLNGSEERQRKFEEVQLNRTNAARKDAIDQIKQQNSALQDQLDLLNEQWDVYKRWMDMTGNSGMAGAVAFGDMPTYGSYREQLRRMLDERLGGSMSADQALAMYRDPSRRSEITKMFGEGSNSASGVPVLLERLDQAETAYFSSMADNMLKLYEDSKLLEQKLKGIDLETIQMSTYVNGLDISDAEKKSIMDMQTEAAERRKADLKFDEFRRSPEWGMAMGELDRLTSTTLESLIEKLNQKSATAGLGAQDMKTLQDAITKLEDELINRNPFSAIAGSITQANRLGDLSRTIGSTIGSRKYGVYTDTTFTPNAAGAKRYGLQQGRQYTKDQVEGEERGAWADLPDGLQGLAEGFANAQKALQPVIDLFDTLGNEDLSNLFQTGSNALGAAASASSGLSALGLGSAGPYGAAIAAGLSVASSLFAMHDKSLQKQIDASKRAQEAFENMSNTIEQLLEYNMGGLYSYSADEATRNQLRKKVELEGVFASFFNLFGGNYKGSELYQAVEKAEASDWDYFSTQYALLIAQRDEAEKQLELEKDKKDSDADAIQDYEQQLTDLNLEIQNFAQDMANELYGIDFKSWADSLTETLVSAWASGANAAKAYKDAVGDILKDVVVSAISQKYIEQMMEPIVEDFLEQFEADNGKMTDRSWGILNTLYDAGDDAVKATNMVMDALEQLSNSKGATLKDNSSGSSTSNGIQSVTEETADLLASYINAIRAYSAENTSALRLIHVSLADHLPAMQTTLGAQLSVQRSIANYTQQTAASNAEILSAIRSVLRSSSDGKGVRVV